MNGLRNSFRKKNPIQKIEKTVKKNKVKLPHVNKKKFHAAKSLAFSLHFLFRRDQNRFSNFTSKIMKMCGQTLKNSALIQFKLFEL